MPKLPWGLRRYNSLRLPSPEQPFSDTCYFVTIDAYKGISFFGDLRLAKQVLSALLYGAIRRKAPLWAYSLLTDHLHFVTSADQGTLVQFIDAFKSYTTQLLWKRSIEILAGQPIVRPLAVRPTGSDRNYDLTRAVGEGRAIIRPESIFLRNFESPRERDFLNKKLWQRSFYDHVVRNTNDFFNTIEYVFQNPVKRGYVSRPEFYPFSGSSIFPI